MKRICLLFIILISVSFAATSKGLAQGATDLLDMSLEDLLNITITTAAKREQTIREAPASVTIITAEQIKRYGYQTLQDVFQSVRSFYTTYDYSYSFMGVRGFSRPADFNNRVLLLIDGHIYNDDMWGSAYIGTEAGLNLDIVERVEIVRGPGSVLYGTHAMFAVVNVITKSGAVIDGVQISAEGGSWGRKEGSAIIGKKLTNGLDVAVSGRWADLDGDDHYFKEYDDPAYNNGLAEGRDWDKYSDVMLTARYGDLTFFGLAGSREKGRPTAIYGENFNDSRSKTLDRRRFGELKWDHALSPDLSVMAKGYADWYTFDGGYPYSYLEGDIPELVDYVNYDYARTTWWGGEVQARWAAKNLPNRLTAGLEYRHHPNARYTNFDVFGEYGNDKINFNVLSAYLEDEYKPTKNMTFVAGLRYDRYSDVERTRLDDTDRILYEMQVSRVTPRLAALYQPMAGSTVKLLYGQAFRAPNFSEITLYIPNPELESEKIQTLEATWEHQLNSQLFGLVSVYKNDITDLIERVWQEDQENWQFTNLLDVEAHGFEVELNARLKNGVSGYASYSFQKSEEKETHEKLSNSPENLLKAGVSVPAGRYFYIAADGIWDDKRLKLNTEGGQQSATTAAYFLGNLTVTTRPLAGHVEGAIQVRNIFDSDYNFPVGRQYAQTSLLQPGRSIVVKITAAF